MTDDEYAAMFEIADSGPLFPEGFGAVLGEILCPTPATEQSGPPWTHSFPAKPPCSLEDCCEGDRPCGCNCHRVQPTHTVVRDAPRGQC